MSNHLRLRLLSLFFLGLPVVSSLDCKDCVEGLNILLEDHLSQASVEGQTQVIQKSLNALDLLSPDPHLPALWIT